MTELTPTEKALQAADALLAECAVIRDAGPGEEEWDALLEAECAYEVARKAMHEAGEREAKAQALGDTLSARLAKVLGDAEALVEDALENGRLNLAKASQLHIDIHTVCHSAPKADPTLEDRLQDRVAAWLKRVAPALALSESAEAELSLVVHGAGSDDDGTLVLEWNCEERLRGPVYDHESSGRVPGTRGP